MPPRVPKSLGPGYKKSKNPGRLGSGTRKGPAGKSGKVQILTGPAAAQIGVPSGTAVTSYRQR